MFKNFFLSELKYALKQPMVYIFFGFMALFTFGATVSDNIQIGGGIGNVYENAPHIITVYTTIMTIFGLLIATAFFNNAALRDYKNNFHEILFSTPLSRSGYFFGRFFGALLLSTIPMLGVFFGVWLGTLVAPIFDWVAPDRFGDFYLETFVNNYLLFILPNMFFAGSIIFALACKFRNTTISFVGTLIIIVGYIISGKLLSDIGNETIAAITDSFGIRTYSVYSKYFTPIEKNTLSPEFTGILLLNRFVWIALGLVILISSYFGFSFQEKNKKVKTSKEYKKESIKPLTAPKLHPTFNAKTEWSQFKSFFTINVLSIVKNVTFKILLLFSVIILISNLIGGFEYYGLQAYPLTYKLIDTINGLTGVFIIIILVFFSGELIWRDRDHKINEVIDATPHTSLISLSAKTLSLVSITTILHAFIIICGIIYQLANGFTRIEIDVYLLDFFYTNFFTYFILSSVMIMIQVLLNNKYLGYFVSIIVIFIWSFVLSMLDIESNMLDIGAGPWLMYSDMNNFGPGLTGAMWFNIYWTLFSILCLFLAGALWNRGTLASLKDKIRFAKKSMPNSYKLSIISIVSLWILVAGFVFYNTQILNPYKTSDEREEVKVAYEKKYKKYQNNILPKITDAKYFIDIFPYRRNVHVKTILELTNKSNQPIDSIHFTIDPKWNPEIKIPNTKLVYEDKELDYSIYKFSPALKPDESVKATIHTKYISKGFQNTRGSSSVVQNGTFLDNFEILPVIGYNESYELSDKNKRKKYGLKPKDRMPKLEENCSINCMKNYLSDGKSDYINVETVISTADDQIAIAPGSLLKKWKEKDRNYYHYKVDHPSQNFYSFLSAKYQLATRKWNGIDIEVYHDQKHPWNVEMMLNAVERSLKYYTENFGPYYHKQCRIVEIPRYASFAQAFPGTMPYSEAVGFVTNLENENKNNIVDAFIAHEMAHQWWAHQIVGADMQGATMLDESFAEYSSLMTMKSIAKTPMSMREFLKYNHHRYLRGRSGEADRELPLYKVENQQYIHYGKGSVILYALQDYIGENNVNTAMRNFLDEFKYKKPPYPTSLDFIRHLEPQVPDSMKYLIKNWIKEITLYDNRMKTAICKRLDNGKYLTTVDIESYKMKADTIGKETKIKVNDWVDIGFFADDDEKRLIFEKRVKIDKSQMSFSFELDSLPVKAGIDPRRLLIDRIYDDNIISVTMSNKK